MVQFGRPVPTLRVREVGGSNPLAPTITQVPRRTRLRRTLRRSEARQRGPGKTVHVPFWPASDAPPMPRTNRPPSYRLHKARNLAVVTIDGKAFYLGPYGSPESHEKYARLIAEWRANRKHLLPTTGGSEVGRTLSVNELILAYWRHVEGYYVKDG